MTTTQNILLGRSVHALRRAFSLVELLLAIFILGIGVIAVAAIFPAGIAQQQASNDEVLGPVVAQHALGVIRSKLDQEDFGTFEQYGIYLDDAAHNDVLVENFSPGDWTWMRPSYLLRGGVLTPTPNMNPDPLDGAIDIFGLRMTRDKESMNALPEASEGVNDGNAFSNGGLFSTSDFALPGINPTFGIEIGQPDYSDGVYQGAETLYGIPYNRNRYAILDPYNPGNLNGHYAFDPAREGRDEPLVTILQSERTWPQASSRPQYVWDCMFRRYQGRVQVAIFVYRASRAAGERSPYAVASGYGTLDPVGSSPQGVYESPLPVRVVLDQDMQWSPRGLDNTDDLNKRDDLDVPGTEGGGALLDPLDPYGAGWQAPGQWILDQNGNVHRVLAGRRTPRDGPVRLVRPVPHVARHAANGNLYSPTGNGPSTVDEASRVKAIWFIAPESRDGMILTPVFVTVRDL